MLEKLISDNQNLIYAIANNYKNYHHKEDLYQVGKLGLIKAYQNFDKSKKVKFTTYAYSYILGEMNKLVREDRSYKINKETRKLNLKIEKAYILLTQKLMHEPTISELANYLEVDEYLISQARKANYNVQSFDSFISEDNSLTLNDVIEDKKTIDIDTLIALKSSLESLNATEKFLIESRYLNDLTQSEVANLLKINQVQVSRMEQKTLKKMRQNF